MLEYFRTSRCMQKLNHAKYFAMQGHIITVLYLCEHLQCELLTYGMRNTVNLRYVPIIDVYMLLLNFRILH